MHHLSVAQGRQEVGLRALRLILVRIAQRIVEVIYVVHPFRLCLLGRVEKAKVNCYAGLATHRFRIEVVVARMITVVKHTLLDGRRLAAEWNRCRHFTVSVGHRDEFTLTLETFLQRIVSLELVASDRHLSILRSQQRQLVLQRFR